MRAAAAALALTGLVALTGVLVPAPATSQLPETSSGRPPGARNVVIVLTDDMRADELRALPHVRRLIGDRGVTFDNAYAVDPVCCPSRVSILTGQYAHNSGVVDNVFPHGGFAAFDDSSSLGTWLDDAGYRTGFIGKYLNQYGKTARRYVPPGWDVWKATVRGVYAYRDPAIYNVNGELERLPGYQTDTVTSLATTFIRANADRPMFLHVNYAAPHEATVNGHLGRPPTPARRHEHAFDGEPPPVDDPSYDEPDVSDKPPGVQRPRLSPEQLTRTQVFAENRLESLLSVDEGVAQIVRSLRTQGVLDSTTIVFTSDNGLMLGEHRYATEKKLVYEPSSRVPLVVRGPGLPTGVVRHHVVGLHDLAPTLLAQTRADAPRPFTIDGRNLVPLMRDGSGTATGRDLLIESLDKDSTWRSYDAIRTTSGYVYVEYAGRGVELYDLAKDPSQIHNLAGRRRHAGLQHRLAVRLTQARDCAGRGCR